MKDKQQDELDALLESVDLSTYALERVKLNEHIGLDASPTALEPQNPNVRGHHGDEEEQRVKLVNIVERVKQSADYEKQVINNPDEQNRRLALETLINQAVLAQRKTDMELYQLRQDEAFKLAFNETVMRILAMQEKGAA